MRVKQNTLKQKISFSGLGVHSGAYAKLTLWPAEEGTGVLFSNALNSSQKITVGTVVPEVAMYATVIKQNGWALSTIEHLVAALQMLTIDNVIVEVHGPEIPILDGSALPFVQGILDAGIAELSTNHRYLTPKLPINFADKHGRSMTITPPMYDNVHVEQNFDLIVRYNAGDQHPLAGGSFFNGAITTNLFLESIAPARTFGLLDQLPFLRQHNLSRGSSLSNTVVLGQELLNEKRYSDECVRHKVLDLLGDLSLLGAQLVGTIEAYRTGHDFNRLVIEHYLQHPQQWLVM